MRAEHGRALCPFGRAQLLQRGSDRHTRLPRHAAAPEAIRLRDRGFRLPNSFAYTQRKTGNREHIHLHRPDWEIRIPLQ